MKHVIFALSAASLLVACAHDAKNQHARDTNANAQQANRAEVRPQAEARPQKDEDGIEAPRHSGDRDRMASANGVPSENDEQVSWLDQGNGEIDLDLTQRIRKAVMADDSLSFSAKNVTIISRAGHVTLRGEVKTPAEKEAIYKCAVREAGVGHVHDELKVDTNSQSKD